MGMLAQHITDDETFTVTGAIVVPRPSLDIANLPLHVVLPDTDPDGDCFATDNDDSPNDPAFFRKVIAHRRGLKRATEVSKGQHLLQLRQQCIGAGQTPVPSSSFPQTNPTGRVDASTSRRNPTPIAGVSSLPADQRTLLYPDPFPVVDDSRSDESDVSNASRRAGKFPDVSPPTTLPTMSTGHELPPATSSTTEPSSATFQRARLSPELLNPTPNTPIVSVWDDEDAEPDDTASPVGSTSSDRITLTTVLLDEVQEELNALCANWESTAPSTVWTMSARFATLLKLAISLDIVGTEDSLRELRDETIPVVHRLLTTIGEMIPRGTTPTMEMENSERPQDPPLGDGIIIDMGSPEGPRIFRHLDRETVVREAQWGGEWLIEGQPIASNV
uniref:Uncharacterized protein n=1 Tax=Moniliophthora roreri TaxID=221103 RepID=A0A0W0F0U2_MONRR